MRIVPICLALIMTAMVSACTHTPPISGAVAGSESAQRDQEARVPNEYLVTLVPDANEGVITKYYGRFGIKYIHALEEDTFLLIVFNDPGPQAMADLIQDESRIKVVQPNLIYWDYR